MDGRYGTEYYINVSNFVTKPYWTYQDDLRTAVLAGDLVMEFNQTSEYYPVDSGGDKHLLKGCYMLK